MGAEPAVISFRGGVEPQHSQPDADRIVKGMPQLTAWNHFTDPTQQFFAGIWAASRGSWRIAYTETEFCHLLAGRVVLISASGRRWEFGAGDSFVVPAGFSGVWEVLEDCRKVYAIFEARAMA